MSKLLIVFLLIVVAVFVFASTLHRPDYKSFKGWLHDHQASFDRTPRVRLTEIHSPQLRQNTLILTGLPTATCTIDPEKGTPSRKLKLTPTTPAPVRFAFVPAEGEPIILPIRERDLDPKAPPEIIIGEKGGSITLRQPRPAGPAIVKLD